MVELRNWITELKTKEPELSNFISRLEGFISETGFDTLNFEKAIETGLQKEEEEAIKTFTSNVEN